MDEVWKNVVGYEGLYSVSSLGRVRGEDKLRDRGRGVKAFVKGRILKQYSSKNYNTVSLVDGKTKKTRTVHSLVAEAFIGERPKSECVCHNNGNSRDNRLSNLRYDTYESNISDKNIHGTDIFGEKHYKSILTEIQARYILAMKGKCSCRDLAEKFNVSISTISKINTGRNWKCLKR